MKPEMRVLRLAHSMGYRYRLHRKDSSDVLQLSKSGQRTHGRVDQAPSHAATWNSLLMN